MSIKHLCNQNCPARSTQETFLTAHGKHVTIIICSHRFTAWLAVRFLKLFIEQYELKNLNENDGQRVILCQLYRFQMLINQE